VITAQLTAHVLSLLGIGTVELFHFHHVPALEIKLLFAPVIIGVVCGACSIIFTHFYHVIDKLIHKILKKLSIKIVFPVLFGCVSVVGFFLSDSLGTGHSLVDRIIHKEILWYVLILAFLVRAIFMMVSNTAGATGGIFLPTLAFGAIIGSLCADAMIALGWIGDEHYILMVVLGISAFLGSTSRIPVTACVFAIEALCGINNVLPIIVATTVALLVVESSGLEDFTDTVIEAKVRSINRGLRPIVVESALTVTEDAFVIGKELRDILWPSSCVVVSYKRAPENYGKLGIAAGDVITVHYKTHHPDATAEEFETLVGEQSEHVKGIMTHHLHEANEIKA
jgi:H+/Cl- antiporter ClcA